MKRFSWAVAIGCLVVAGTAAAQQQAESDRPGSPRARPRGWLGDGVVPAAVAQQPQVAAQPQAGKAVSLSIVIVEVAKSGGKKPSLDLANAETIPEQLRALEEKGEATVITRVRLSSLENNPCSVQIGQSRPIVAGRAAFPAGRGPRAEGDRPNYSYQMVNVGTMVTVTSRVEAGDAIVAQIQVESSGLDFAARPQTDDPIAQHRTTTLQSQSTVRIPKGRGIIVSAAQSAGADESCETLILVSGHVEETTPAGKEKAAGTEKAADAPTDEVRVFALQHASATDVTETLQKLFVGRAVFFAPEERTNNLIVRGNASQLGEIEALIERLDRGE